MDSLYEVVLKPSVHKDLRLLPKAVVVRVVARIEALEQNPQPRGAIKLTGAERLFRIRVGNYRIVYELNSEARLVTILYVRHRREAYRAL
jgi:mRNA interferase RelE/StbE